MKLKQLKPEDYHIYMDLDGVMADLFTKMEEITGHTLDNREDDRASPADQAAWDKFHDVLKTGKPLFLDMKMMPGARELWNYVKKYHPYILTATGRWNAEDVDRQKRKWVDKHLPGHGKIYTVMASPMKAKFAWPDSILIDDRMKSIRPWREAGGIGIQFKTADQVISELKALGL